MKSNDELKTDTILTVATGKEIKKNIHYLIKTI